MVCHRRPASCKCFFKYKLLLNFGFRLVRIFLPSSCIIPISIHWWLLRPSILVLSILHLILFSVLLIYIFTNLPTCILWRCLCLNILSWGSFNTIGLSFMHFLDVHIMMSILLVHGIQIRLL